MDVLAIDNKCFMRMLSEDSTACANIMRVLAERLADTTADLIAARAELLPTTPWCITRTGLAPARCDGQSGGL